MKPLAKEIKSYLGSAEMSEDEFIEHYGMPRRSGRYPYGSGKDAYQHRKDFLGRIERLKKAGWEETTENIEKTFHMKSTEYRREKKLATEEMKIHKINTARSLQKDGLSTSEIGRKMGVNESTVRGWFQQDEKGEIYQTRETVNFLKEQVDKKRMIDVGLEVERELGITRTRLDTALKALQQEGYNVYSGRIPQPTNANQSTTQKVLAAPDVKHKEIYDYSKVKTITEYKSSDDGQSYQKKFTYPESMDSKRMVIRYKEDGGIDKDGIVELRRNVPDLSLGNSIYSQVRILVDKTHYIKGMAVYGDDKDFPPGVDVIFNTNKSKTVPKMKVLKEIKKDPDNPFGANIKDADQGGQYWYTDPKTGKKKLGLINKRADQGDWTEWADAVPSQFLSKQNKQLAAKQLNLAKADKEDELHEYMSLTNPTIKKYYLKKFADKCDGAAVDLKAAALPGQKYHVLIPNNTLKDDEIYAPGYADGTKLALVRYPHGGTFEIPICRVNNKNKLGRKLIGTDSIDAVCINAKVAERLSGADFDGDTVMCIPTHDKKGKVRISSRKQLEGLEGFDPKVKYGSKEVLDKDGKKKYYCGDREIKIMKNTEKEMGEISNLITDMTLAGADEKELAAAVRHSMVVIDAEKHKLDYRRSYIDNNIEALRKRYQPKYDENGNFIRSGGASTIISKAKGPKPVPRRRGEPRVNIKGKSWYDPERPEGALIYFNAADKDTFYPDGSYDKKTKIRTLKTVDGKKITYNMDDEKSREKYEPVLRKHPRTGDVSFTNRDKSIIYRTKTRTIDTTNMADTDDARTLVSKAQHPMELLYADHANYMKSLANRARMEVYRTGNLKQNKNAKNLYAQEVASLNKKLNDALINRIKERQALRIANQEIDKKKELDPTMKTKDIKKLGQREVSKAREEVGSVTRKDRNIKITDKEWEAIQAGAISESKLKDILANSDPDVLRERAMPKAKVTLSSTQINRIKAMSLSNFTLEQIATKMGISKSTVSKCLKGEK